MNLTELVPRESSFYLRLVKKKFHLRPITLSDEIWLDKEYGDGIKGVFENVNIAEISRIAFRLIRGDDKRFFEEREVEVVGENGNQENVKTGGLELFRMVISGWKEKEDLMKALLENMGFSRPEVTEMEKEAKKKVNQRIGAKY